jgi:hypothetical protein
MAARKRSQSHKAEEKETEAPQAPEQPTTEEVYAGYSAPAAADQVEVRVNGKVVFLDKVFNAKVESLSSGGVSVKGSSEAPKSSSKKSEPELYNPQEQESRASVQMSPVPETDPEYTEALDESATPDDDEK